MVRFVLLFSLLSLNLQVKKRILIIFNIENQNLMFFQFKKVTNLATQVFRHLHKLDLNFHLNLSFDLLCFIDFFQILEILIRFRVRLFLNLFNLLFFLPFYIFLSKNLSIFLDLYFHLKVIEYIFLNLNFHL